MNSVRQGTNAAAVDADLPVALASVSVAGQCRERSPIDLALFGETAERFVERFADRLEGEALLARALGDGAAEAHATLLTAAGTRDFRVSLWRQRGGEKVRLIAAFATTRTGRESEGALLDDVEPELRRIAHDLHGPIGAILALTQSLREDAGGLDAAVLETRASDIAAAAWRMARLADELRTLGPDRSRTGLGREVELDLARLIHRARRLALPEAVRAGVSLSEPVIAAPTALPGVLSDESVLRGVMDDLLRLAILGSGQGGSIRVELGPVQGGGIVAAICGQPSDGPVPDPPTGEGSEGNAVPDGLRRPAPRPESMLRQLAAMAGASLTITKSLDCGVQAHLSFAPSRCLPAPDGT